MHASGGRFSKSVDWGVAAGAAAWIFVVCIGLRILFSYGYTPGGAGDPPVQWPSGTRIRRVSGRATLVMLAHPRCPCTRASLGELELLIARLHGRLVAHVFFYAPENPSADWLKSDLWDRASGIPDVSAKWDNGDVEARRFGGFTSGQVMLYDAAGRLLFRGGITDSRGHSGDNPGRDAIVSAVIEGIAGRAETPVFGCSLLDARSTAAQ
jgi:hypothetical protein